MADRTALARATEGTEAPTPGYLYLDIAKSAAASPVACSEIATYLAHRLQKNNPNIKYKALKVMAKVAESPVTRGQFKRTVCQDPSLVSAVKSCLQFRGPPDAARGDEPSQRVRDAAKECLDAIYSESPSSEHFVPHGQGMTGIGGGGAPAQYAPSPYAQSGGGGGHSSGPRRMEGIGNPRYANQQHVDHHGQMTLGEVAAVAGETIVGMIKDPLARNIPDVPPSHSGRRMEGFGSGSYAGPPPGRAQLAHATKGEWTMASNRGPNAVGGPSSYSSDSYAKSRDATALQWAQGQSNPSGASASTGGVGGSWGSVATAVPVSMPAGHQSVASQARAAPHQSYPAPTSGAICGSGGSAVSDGSYERNLIVELCPPGGMKAEPPPDKLAAYARAVPSLNSDLICPALLDCLEDGQPWLIKAKALCVMETTLRVAAEHAEPGKSNPYADFFFACAAEIEPLASHTRAAIREPAKSVLKALGIEPSGPGSVLAAATPASAAAPPRQADPPNLLDFDDPALAPVSTPNAAPPVSAPPPPGGSGDFNLFGGLNVQAKEPASPPPPPPTAPVPAPSSGNLLGNLSSDPASGAVPAASSGGLFGDLKVKAETNETPAAPAEKDSGISGIVTGGSAFGFMNSDSPAAAATTPDTTSQPEPKAEAPASPAPTKESFDPLLSLGAADPKADNPAPAPTMADVARMQQEMTYQQNMMMMQQQMQQMQMALAYQAQGKMPPQARMAQQQRTMGGSFTGSRPAGGTMPMNHNIMKSNSISQIPNIGGAGVQGSSFSFLEQQKKEKEEHSFDFVKDAMKDEKK